MPVIFEKSAIRCALESAVSAIFAIGVGALFAGLLWFAEDIPLIVKIACVVSVLISAVMTAKYCRDALAYVRQGEGWRVEIDGKYLSWMSPSPDFMDSFRVPLSDIRAVRHEVHEPQHSEMSPQHKFYIDLADGTSTEIKCHFPAIDPIKVFKALEQRGVPYFETTIHAGPNAKTAPA